MFVPNQDNRLFMQELDMNLFTIIPYYTPDEYEQQYPLLLMKKPEIFSINLKDELMEFATSCPPGFTISVHEVIDFGCFYYADWDTAHMAIVDEFIEVGVTDTIRQHLINACYDVSSADEEFQRQLEILSEALRKLLTVILGILARCDAPSIMDFGSCYRLFRIDDFGNVFFKMEVPSQVFDAVENSELVSKTLTLEPVENMVENTIILSAGGLPGNY